MEQTFEAMLEQLEKVVKKLETKEIALDDAVKEYKKGLELAKACYTLLENAEKVLVKTQE
jgi:exodeoxyribonuclease VII small subunit